MTTTATKTPAVLRNLDNLASDIEALKRKIARRDRLIRQAHEKGHSYRAIAEHAGMTYQNVALIVQKGDPDAD